jgi:hypothetical protein
VGFTSGACRLLDPASLADSVAFKNGKDPITMGSFSPRGDFFAYADSANYMYEPALMKSPKHMEDPTTCKTQLRALGPISTHQQCADRQRMLVCVRW